MVKLIATGCRKRTGKSTFAGFVEDYLSDTNKGDSITSSFVEPARRYARDVFPDIPDTDENKDAYRDLMISIVKPTLDRDPLAYTKYLVNKFKELSKDGSDSDLFYLVPDLRRDIEWEYCKEQLGDDFVSIRIDRGNPTESFGEGSIDDDKFYDLIIDNNGTLEDLKKEAKLFVDNIRGE